MEAGMSTFTTRRLSGATLVVLLAAMLSGCVAIGTGPAGANPNATSSPDAVASADAQAVPTAQDAPRDCLNKVSAEEGYGAPTTLNDFYNLNAGAVIGKFGNIGQAHWNTPDSSRPADVHSTAAVPVRPLTAADPQVVAGNPNPSRMVLVGGTVGCDTLSLGSVDSIALVAGQKYVFIVFQIDDSAGKPSGDWSLLAAWPMNDKGIVSTAADGDMTVGDIQQALLKGAPEVTPPTLEEPSGPG
jgi:hypothetical protein